MHESEVLYDVLIFLLAAVVVVSVLGRFRSSPVIGFLVAGMLIGPHALGLIKETGGVDALAELGVVFLLFMIGLELSIERLRRLARYVFGLGAVQVLVTGLLIGGIAMAAGESLTTAIVIGSGLALSSTAFVLQLLTERGERSTRYGQASFAILLFQDLIIVPLLILVPLLGEQGSTLLTALGSATVKATLAFISALFVGRLILRPAYRMIASVGASELFVATTLLVVLGTSWAFSQAGLSMALGAFLAGLLLAETEYRHQVEADIRPFRGILLGLFFMTIGMTIDVRFIFTEIETVLLLVVALLLGKTLITAGLCRLFGLPATVAVRVGPMLSQGGEFGFVLFGVAAASGIFPAALEQLLLAVVTLSMATTPIMAHLGSRLVRVMTRRDLQDLGEPGELAEDVSDHVLIVGFGRVGQTVAKILAAHASPYVALDLDHVLVSRCRERGMPVFYGNASQVSVLRAAGAERARAAVITIDQAEAASQAVAALHESWPDLAVFVRARDMSHSRLLERHGAAAVVPDTLEASLQLGGIVLRALGSSTDDVAGVLEDFREEDYAKLQEILHGRQETDDG